MPDGEFGGALPTESAGSFPSESAGSSSAQGGGSSSTHRLWGGRFASGPAPEVMALSRSVQFDWRLAPYDLRASRAHARVLHRAGLLDDAELGRLLGALDEIEGECRAGTLLPGPDDEDVHTVLERALLERLGSLGGKLRAGRSRNDQIATDLRLYLRDEARSLAGRLIDLQRALIEKAEEYVDLPAPGMTHLQHAQPVLFAHHLLAHVVALARDLDRLRDWDRRAAVCPLGAGALAGSSLPLDPVAVAHELGFTAPALNSIDAVSDRDFVAEFAFIAALIGVHLSRLGEEIVLWCSQEFGWVELDDAYATGSSIMPQKKNPDVAELTRGKSGRLVGDLTAILVMLKGLPLAYDRDLQEDKEPVFDAVDTLALAVPAVTGMISTMRVNTDRVSAAATLGFSLATDVAEALVRRGVPFHEAHQAVGRLVAWCLAHGRDLSAVDDDQLAAIAPQFTAETRGDVRAVLSVRGALAARDGVGGTAPRRVAEQLATLRALVDEAAAWARSGEPGVGAP